MTKSDEEHFEKKIVCQFTKKIGSNKVIDHCRLTGKYTRLAHEKCTHIVTQKQNNFHPFIFQKKNRYDSHLFSQKLFDQKKGKVKMIVYPSKKKKI